MIWHIHRWKQQSASAVRAVFVKQDGYPESSVFCDGLIHECRCGKLRFVPSDPRLYPVDLATDILS